MCSTSFWEEDVSAEDVHGENGIDDFITALIDEFAEAFMSFDEVLAAVFGDDVELGAEVVAAQQALVQPVVWSKG